MIAKDFNVNQLATAVMWWLSYTSAVGRNYVLSEGAIKFPASEYLERSKLDEIELEFNHPKLSRKRFDLFFRKNSVENTAFEFKYIKNGSTRTQDEKQRIFNDLMRLYLYLDKSNKGYFLICGNQSDFVKDFQTILTQPKDTTGNLYIKPRQKDSLPKTIQPEGFYTEWFSFDTDKPDKEIDLKTSIDEYKNIYDLFFKEYSDPYLVKTKFDLTRPDKIMTKLVFLSGNTEQPTGLFQPSKIGIWEVLTI
jgi:hypothetical protein